MSKHLFLLTRLIRGVTLAGHTADSFLQISTHTPHTRRDAERLTHIEDGIISTHTPHTRRDAYGGYVGQQSGDFYSHASYEA